MLTIANNFVSHNAGGGIRVNTTTKDNEVALYANITNNVIVHNTHGEALQLEGKFLLHCFAYQEQIRDAESLFTFSKRHLSYGVARG